MYVEVAIGQKRNRKTFFIYVLKHTYIYISGRGSSLVSTHKDRYRIRVRVPLQLKSTYVSFQIELNNYVFSIAIYMVVLVVKGEINRNVRINWFHGRFLISKFAIKIK